MSYQSGTNKIFYKNLSWTNDFVKSNIDKIERNYEKHPTRTDGIVIVTLFTMMTLM